jgi:hypothetical protein
MVRSAVPRAHPSPTLSVYTDCVAHTITLYPKNPGQLLLYVSAYPLRPLSPGRTPATVAK